MEILSHPNQIRVGFQKREDTYSGLLSYIIYMNKGNKYGKEKSFNSWIDGSIPIQDINNEFLSGFVLNKTVSRHYRGSSGTAAFRIYHPNGYEFEISPVNFANICSNCDISSGEIMEPCTVAWDAAELVLIPKSFITQNLVSFNEIDVVSKISKKNKDVSINIQNKTFIPLKKLKAESIYLHENGREYFLSGNVKNKSSLLNSFNIVSMDEIGTIRSFFNKRNHNNNYQLFPFAIDCNQDTVIDENFMSKFISVINKPLSTMLKMPEHFLSLFIPFNKNVNIKQFDGSNFDKNIILSAAHKLKNRFIKYEREKEEIVLPLTISVNGIDYLLSLSFSNIMSNFNFSDEQKNILNKYNLSQCDFRMFGYTSLSLNFSSLTNTENFSIVSSNIFEEIRKNEQNQASFFKKIENISDNPLSLLSSISNMIHVEESEVHNVHKVNYEQLTQEFIGFLTDILKTTQQNKVNLDHFIIKMA